MPCGVQTGCCYTVLTRLNQFETAVRPQLQFLALSSDSIMSCRVKLFRSRTHVSRFCAVPVWHDWLARALVGRKTGCSKWNALVTTREIYTHFRPFHFHDFFLEDKKLQSEPGLASKNQQMESTFSIRKFIYRCHITVQDIYNLSRFSYYYISFKNKRSRQFSRRVSFIKCKIACCVLSKGRPERALEQGKS